MKKVSFFLFAILFATVAFMSSTNAQTVNVSSLSPIGEAHPQIKAIKEMASKARVASTFSKSQWKEAQLATYSNGVKAIIVPVESDKIRSLQQVTFITKNNELSETVIFEIIPEKPKTDSQTKEKRFSGKAAFYALDGTQINSAEYKDDKLLGINENTSFNANSNKRLRKNCFLPCLKNIYTNLPAALKAACVTSCVVCITTPAWVTCLPCAACILVPATICFVGCQE